MQTGENEQGLRKIIDLTRAISIVVLILHFYFYCFTAFEQWHLTAEITTRLMLNIERTGLFSSFNKSKLIAIGFLVISLVGARGRKSENLTYKNALIYSLAGVVLFFCSYFLYKLNLGEDILAIGYITMTCLGYVLFLTGGTLFSRIIKVKLSDDVFNSLNETFPQEERLLTNEYSINLPAVYNLKGKQRKSWVNVINPLRGLLIMGSPGSGKSYFIIQHIIKQHIQKGFSMFIYDFKYDDLSKIAYNYYLATVNAYPIKPQFYAINFDDLSKSSRCNPLDVGSMRDITDAAESSRTIMLGLNQEWIQKQGDFFVESPINFVTALIWFLRSFQQGKYCTLAHVIELAQTPYKKLFSVLRSEPQIEALINPFVTAYLNGAKEQLEGQVASATISLARLSSPQLYYILNGNDLTLDVSNPKSPKIVCIGNNPQKSQTYGAVISLYLTALTRKLNQKGNMKSSLILDEFPTIYFNGIDSLVATARSNKIATTIAVQDASQLKFYYGREQADVILNLPGNIISGQVTGETAKHLSERIGKIMQDRESLSINSSDTSVTKSKQLEFAIPASRIAALSSGEFVGVVADNPEEKIKLKTFCSEIINDHAALKRASDAFKELPQVRDVSQNDIDKNYLQVKQDVEEIIESVTQMILNTPEMEHLIIKK